MTKNVDIKKTIIKCLSCLLLVCAFCALTNDVWAANAGCSEANKCFPGCKYNQVETCTLCPLFVLVFNTVSKVGSLSAENFSGGIIKVVVVCFAIWLAMETVKFVYEMKTKDLKDFAQAIITKGFVVILVVLILQSGVGNFYNIFIQPVYNTAQSMSQIMFKDGKGIGTNKDDKKAQNDKAIADIKEIKNGLPSSMGASIVRTMTMMENRVRKLNALGAGMVCQSWADGWFIFPVPRYFIFGGAVWVLTIAIIVMVPFIMIDSVFQLGVATALMPFAVGAYAFDFTKKKLCKKVWDTFLNSAFAFLFTSVVVLILLGAIQTATQSGIGGVAGFDDMFVVGSSGGDNTFAKFKETVSWGSGAFLNLLFIFLLAWSVMNMGVEFANKFASESISSTNIGSQLGGKALSLGKTAAGKMSAPAGNMLKNGASKFAGRVGRGIKHAGGRMASKAKEAIFDARAKRRGGSTENGVTTFKTIGGAEMTKDENGNITKKKEKIKRNGTKIVTENKEVKSQNAIVRIQTITTMKQKEDGSWEIVNTKSSKSMQALSEKVEGFMGKDGKCNFQAVEKMLEGTNGETRNILRSYAMEQITESRFSKSAFDPSKAKLKGPAETVMNKDGSIVTKYTLADGGVVFSSAKMRADGLVESSLTRVGKDGEVLTLQTDGVRNKFSESKLKKDTDISKINSANDVMLNSETDEQGRVAERVGYSYSNYYQQQLNNGMHMSEVPDGMFFHRGKDGITRDEYGEVVRDKEGNAKGGAFSRFMKNSQAATIFKDEDGNQSKNRLYASTISDLGFYFKN